MQLLCVNFSIFLNLDQSLFSHIYTFQNLCVCIMATLCPLQGLLSLFILFCIHLCPLFLPLPLIDEGERSKVSEGGETEREGEREEDKRVIAIYIKGVD